MLAIIGGSSLVKLPILEVTHRQIVRTPYGDPSCPLLFGRIGQQNVVFMARHGYGNSIAPHEINYRANIWALQSVGAKSVIAIGAVGGIRPDLSPGTLVIPDDVLDYTWGRKHTFFEGVDCPLVHADFTRPYSDDLRHRLLAAAGQSQVHFSAQATYACTQGAKAGKYGRNPEAGTGWCRYCRHDRHARGKPGARAGCGVRAFVHCYQLGSRQGQFPPGCDV